MLTRSLAILLAPWLPLGALMLPMSAAHRIDGLVAGALGIVLSAFSLSNDRARIAAAAVGAWVALTALVFPSTLLEATLALSWGALMFAWLAGPFSTRPAVITSVAPAAAADARDGHLPLAA